MLFQRTYAVVVMFSLNFVFGNSHGPSAPVQVLETRRDTTALLGDETLQSLRRDLVTAGLKQRDSDTQLYETNGSLDLMWNDATLFS